ncbi:MAG: response regulator transcription factor [Acidobacteria bacterium]|nr:response regulator transcription factor [Acidobacteriota bacterium]
MNFSRPDLVSLVTLTRREHMVLKLIGDGMGTRMIADALSISVDTVRNHVQNIFSKLHVHSRVEAVTMAFRGGLVESISGGFQRK